jgi:antitoxin (DNA-binding transcriptional repressor) of toxin-antitoxin stability system
MERYSLQDAQDQLEQLIADAQHGKTIIILDDQDRAVQLVPIKMERTERKPGSAKGQVQMAADFDAPLIDFDDYTK